MSLEHVVDASQPSPSLPRWLAWCGVLPFVALAAASALGVDQIALIGAPDRLLQIYGLLILGFMAGVHWGQMLSKPGSMPGNLFISSNAVVLLVFFSAALRPTLVLPICMSVGFAILVWVDHRLARAGAISPAYWRMRWQVSAVVIASLLISLI